jgi:hypothetical protein
MIRMLLKILLLFQIERYVLFKISFFPFHTLLNPCEYLKKVAPRHQSRYIGSTLDVVYRKPKAFGISFFFIRKLTGYIFASEISNSRICDTSTPFVFFPFLEDFRSLEPIYRLCPQKG